MKERQKQESERRTIVRLQGGRASERQSVHHNVPRYTTGKSMAEATRPPARCRPSLAAPTSSSSSSVSSCSSSSSYFYLSFSLAIVLCLRVRDGQWGLSEADKGICCSISSSLYLRPFREGFRTLLHSSKVQGGYSGILYHVHATCVRECTRICTCVRTYAYTVWVHTYTHICIYLS